MVADNGGASHGPEQPLEHPIDHRQVQWYLRVQRYLRDADWPADRETLIRLALRNDASERFVRMLKTLDTRRLQEPSEVAVRLGDRAASRSRS